MYFTIDHSWPVNSPHSAVLDSKLGHLGHDTCKVILSYLDDFDLLDYVSFAPDRISKDAEDLLSKRGTIVERYNGKLHGCNTLTFN